jgi:hypothetical protein
VIADPRTSLIERLEVVVVAELADNEGWRALAALAPTADRQDLLTFIESAEATEAEHLTKYGPGSSHQKQSEMWERNGHGVTSAPGSLCVFQLPPSASSCQPAAELSSCAFRRRDMAPRALSRHWALFDTQARGSPTGWHARCFASRR